MSARIFLFIYNYVYPPLGFPLMWWLWARREGHAMAALVLGVPLVYGYVIPGIGTNVLKKWRFKGHFLAGRFFLHHGFIYSSTMALALYVAMYPAGKTVVDLVFVVLRCAACVGFVAWWHDTLAVRHGLVEVYNGPWLRGAAPETIVTHYAPLCFSLLGASYGLVGELGRRWHATEAMLFYGLFPAGFLLLSAATVLPYLATEKY